MSKESDKEYRHKWYLQHREEQKERTRAWRQNNPDKVRAIRKKHNDKVKAELKQDHYTVTKEEWLKRYGYEMGSAEGWEHWLGWDNRIRRGEE